MIIMPLNEGMQVHHTAEGRQKPVPVLRQMFSQGLDDSDFVISEDQDGPFPSKGFQQGDRKLFPGVLGFQTEVFPIVGDPSRESI